MMRWLNNRYSPGSSANETDLFVTVGSGGSGKVEICAGVSVGDGDGDGGGVGFAGTGVAVGVGPTVAVGVGTKSETVGWIDEVSGVEVTSTVFVQASARMRPNASSARLMSVNLNLRVLITL